MCGLVVISKLTCRDIVPSSLYVSPRVSIAPCNRFQSISWSLLTSEVGYCYSFLPCVLPCFYKRKRFVDFSSWATSSDSITHEDITSFFCRCGLLAVFASNIHFLSSLAHVIIHLAQSTLPMHLVLIVRGLSPLSMTNADSN